VKDITLKKCPFCATKRAEVVESAADDKRYLVLCGKCNTQTADYADVKGAARRWNNRKSLLAG
jgi:Lar family restriction alleviation protein|tara:strand:+ start:879 stop:1067 length:189 start_codon:yes stop_codon:yes gene_type:complete